MAATATLLGAGTSLSGCNDSSRTNNASALDPTQGINITDSFSYVDNPEYLTLDAEWTFPAGTVLFPSEGVWIGALGPSTSTTQPLCLQCFSSTAGKLITVLDTPYTHERGMVFYTLGCTDELFVWVELNENDASWKLYACAFSNGVLSGSAHLLFESDTAWDPPQFACSGSSVVFLLMPATGGSQAREASRAYYWDLSMEGPALVQTSTGRYGCAPSISAGICVLAPRVNATSTSYTLNAYTCAKEFSLRSQLELPQGVRPASACFMQEKFVFQINAAVTSAGTLGQLGTYIQTSDSAFALLNREPAAPVCGAGGIYVIKSTNSLLAVDIVNNSYGAINAPNHSADYGEFPARVGICDTLLCFSAIKNASTGSNEGVTVRVWKFS